MSQEKIELYGFDERDLTYAKLHNEFENKLMEAMTIQSEYNINRVMLLMSFLNDNMVNIALNHKK